MLWSQASDRKVIHRFGDRSRFCPPMNCRLGRAALCAPRTWKERLFLEDGAHGVTRPTYIGFRGFKTANSFGEFSHSKAENGGAEPVRSLRSLTALPSCWEIRIRTSFGFRASGLAKCGVSSARAETQTKLEWVGRCDPHSRRAGT